MFQNSLTLNQTNDNNDLFASVPYEGPWGWSSIFQVDARCLQFDRLFAIKRLIWVVGNLVHDNRR